MGEQREIEPRELLGPGLVAVALLGALWWTWQTWADVLVDFGRELYVPWRLVEGDVLYRDVSYFNGPLSAYFNAALFKIFGTGLRTLVLANVAILIAALTLTYRLVADLTGRFTATVSCLVFVLLFACAQFLTVSNFNWIAPYSHEVTHGLALGLGGITCLRAYGRTFHVGWAFGAGLCAGLCFLTKPEVFLATLAATKVGLFAVWRGRRPPPSHLLATLAGGLLPLGLAVALLALVMPAGEAFRGALGGWPHLLSGDLGDLHYYRVGLGTDDVPASLRRIALWTAGYMFVLAPALGLAWSLEQREGPRVGAVSAGVFALVAVGGLLVTRSWSLFTWYDAAAPLSLAALLLTAALGWRLRQDATPRLAIAFALSVFGLALLAKMALNPRIVHYGFGLALPATVALLAVGLGWLPAQLEARGRAGWVLRAAVLGLLFVLARGYLGISQGYFDLRAHVVGEGDDALLADGRGGPVNALLADLPHVIGPEQTLAVFPEGASLNYLARRPSSTPYYNFMPPELVMFGQAKILAAFRASPPDFVALVHKDTSVYGEGYQYFGRDYGHDLHHWIETSYEPMLQVGATPLREDAFGILLLRRRR